MGLREYAAMWRHWAKQPPLPVLAAGYLGWKPPATAPVDQEAAIGELFAMFGGMPEPGKTAVIR